MILSGWYCELFDQLVQSLSCIAFAIWLSVCSSLCLIPLKKIRPAWILNVLPYSLVEYVLLWPHRLVEISREGCGYLTGTPWSGNTRWGYHVLVCASCTSGDIHVDDLPYWGALVWWVLVPLHRLDDKWASWWGMTVSTLNSDDVRVIAEVGK